MPRRTPFSTASILPLALTAGVLLACNAALGGLRAQSTGSGDTLPLTTSGATVSSMASSAAASMSSYSAVIRNPILAPGRSAPAGASVRSTVASSSSVAPVSLSGAALSDDEQDFRAMIGRVIAAKNAAKAEEEGLTLVLDPFAPPPSDVVIRAEDAEDDRPRGCFTASGIWTIDGTVCAGNQAYAFVQLRERSRFEQEPVAMGLPIEVLPIANISLAVPVEEAEEVRMTSILSSWFPPGQDGVTSAHETLIRMFRRNALHSTLTAALEQVQAAASDTRFVPSVYQKLMTHVVWMQQTLGLIAALPTIDLAQLASMESELGMRLVQAQESLGELPSVPPGFVSMQQFLGRIIDRTPLVFARLGDAEIELPSTSAEAYLRAKELYDTLNTCDGFLPCPALEDTVTALRDMADGIAMAIEESEQYWMYDEVDLMYTAE